MVESRVARLATRRADGGTDLVPITFAVLDGPVDGPAFPPSRFGVLVSAIDHKPKRSARPQRLANVTRHPEVQVLVDHYEDDWTRLWWVRLDGWAVELDEPARQRAVEALVVKYEQYADRPPDGPVLGVAVTSWQGWAWSGGPATPRRSST